MTHAFHILGLFPEILDAYFSASLIGKARAAKLLDFHYHQLRDFAEGKARMVDDKVYGGGQGMVFMADVVCRAVRELKKNHGIEHVVLTSPRGTLLTPKVAKRLSDSKNILFVCGRYEGVDQRAIDLVIDEEISVGDYVLTGGEIAAGVMIDATARYIPGVVQKMESVHEDSFENGLLEHPQFTRPENFEGLNVPEILLSGNHAKILEWKRNESLKMTWSRRPDLFRQVKISDEEREFLKSYIHRTPQEKE